MQLITYRADSVLNFGIFSLLVRYWSSVDDFPLNKSIEVTLRMQVVSLNKSIGVRLPSYSIGFRDLDIWSPVLAMLPYTASRFSQFASNRNVFEPNAFLCIIRILW